MTEFVLLFQGGDPTWMETRTPDEAQRVLEEWGAWFKELERSGHLRSPGNALAPGGATLRSNGKSILTDQALPEVKELVGGYSVIAADSLEEATELAKGTPFLRNHPDGRVLVRPVLQVDF
jgi:hypothetical protein